MTIKKGVYQHFKGNRYRVLAVARHSETEEQFVVYQPLYGDQAIWVRPLTLFDEMIERDGQLIKRFRLIEEETAK